MSKEIIIYRGPLERARLKLLISSITSRQKSKVIFVWIYPKILDADKRKHFDEFISYFDIENVFVYYDKGHRALNVKSQIKRYFQKNTFEIAHFIGFKSYFFSSSVSANKKVWYVNGIPEESLLHSNSLSNRFKCYLNWASVKSQKKPDLIITVSKPMMDYVRKKRIYN